MSEHLAYGAIFVVGIILIALYRGWMKAPSTLGLGASVSAWLARLGGQTALTILAPVVSAGVVYFFLWRLFPGFLGKYEANGGPVLEVFLAALVVGLVMAFVPKNFRWAASLPILLLLGIAVAPAAYHALPKPEKDPSGSERSSAATTPAPRVAWPSTPQCPGGLRELILHSESHMERVSTHPCQVRVFVFIQRGREKGSCAILYDSGSERIGRSCAETHNVVNGITYFVGGEGSEPVKVHITLCPLGSSGRNMGSCT